MEEYLFQLLENNNRVIVPEFGAFIVKKRHPMLLVFNEFLQYNDGVLTDLIVKKENIGADKAKIKIEEFIKNINDALDNGKSFHIEKLGFMTKNKSGKISLEVSENSADDESPTGDNEIAIDQDKPVTQEKPIITEKKEDTAPVSEKNPILESEKNIPPEKTQPVGDKNKKPQTNEISKKPLSNNNIKKTKKTPSEDEIKPVSKTIPGNKRYYLIWAIVIIAINAVIITYFFRNNKLSDLFLKPATEEFIITDTTIQVPTESIPSDPAIKEEIESADIQQVDIPEKTNIVPDKITSGKRFYIVAGVFREEKNAQNFVLELKNKGYNSEQFTKIGASFAVSYSVFTSKPEAEKALLKIKNEIDPGAWIKVIE